MEIAFETKRLRDICESEVIALDSLGTKAAKKLFSRLADIRAIDHINEIPTRNANITTCDGAEQVEIKLAKNYKMIFTANHNINPTDKHGKVDWTRVYRIKIINISLDCDE